jgi:hypothetical protein
MIREWVNDTWSGHRHGGLKIISKLGCRTSGLEIAIKPGRRTGGR